MRELLARIIFGIHAGVVLFWYGLFFASITWWPGEIGFLFPLTCLIVGHQFLWGFAIFPWTREYRMVCILTTLTQWLRGEDISDTENYKHSFTKELFGKAGITISHGASSVISLVILVIVALQYFSL